MVGMALPVEEDRWLVGLVGWHINDLPDDDEVVAAAARALPDPAIAKLLDRVQPVTDPVTARLRSNHRRLSSGSTAYRRATWRSAMPSAASIPSTAMA